MINVDLFKQKLSDYDIATLRTLGKEYGVSNATKLKKNDLILAMADIAKGVRQPNYTKRGRPTNLTGVNLSVFDIIRLCQMNIADEQEANNKEELSLSNVQPTVDIVRTGLLEIQEKGFGLLKMYDNYKTHSDIFISTSLIETYDLRQGDKISGVSKVNYDNYEELIRIVTINDVTPISHRVRYEDTTPVFSDRRISIYTENELVRAVDKIAPLGFGQRGLFVCKQNFGVHFFINFANAMADSYPETKIMILLIDEKPEDATYIKRNVHAKVICSTFDETVYEQMTSFSLIIEHCKRLIEMGQDSILLINNINRLGRIFNLSENSKTKNIEKVKNYFGVGRNVEQLGSLTLYATIDIENMNDKTLYENLRDVCNFEIVQDYSIRSTFALDYKNCSADNVEFLLTQKELKAYYQFRRDIDKRIGRYPRQQVKI